MRKISAAIICAASVALTSSVAPSAYAADGSGLLTSCVNAVNDPLYTKTTMASIMGYANVSALESAITNNTLIVWIANGSGVIAGSASANGNGQDLFCGDSNDNTIAFMDSFNNSRDYFFGGAGNDSVTATMWYSAFYGGPGNDYVDSLEEASIFDGGPGTDSYRSISINAPWASTFIQGVDTLDVTSFSIAGNVKVVNYRSSLILTLVVTTAARVSFSANGKRIAGCINKSASGSGSTFTVNCSWRPTNRGTTSLSASIVQTGSNTLTNYSHPTQVTVLSRTGSRTP